MSLHRLSAAAALVAVVLMSGATARPAAAAQTDPGGPNQAQTQALAYQGYEYGIPLMEFLRQARQQTSVTVANAHSDAPLNQLGSARSLATAADQVIVQPNNDTLYTMGHLDLAKGALVLHVPAIGGHRYYSFEFLDPYTNVFHYVGTRTTGDGAGSYAITGPGFRGRLPPGLTRIRSAYRRMWLVGRTLARGAADLPAVHRIQDGYRLIPLAAFRRQGLAWRAPGPSRIVTRHRVATEPRGLAFFDALGTALADNPPPARDAPILRALRRIGVGPGLHPSREHLSAAARTALRNAGNGGYAHVFSIRTAIAARSVVAHGGWFVPPFINGAFGTDYAYRAVVALFGIAANRPQEALYIIGVTDPSHQYLDGSHHYVIHFAPGQLPPARFFWSLTMYDENFFLVSNPIDRYALGSHTAGLTRNPDGSLDIYVQQTAPAGHTSNWLPSPAGRFEVTMRLYGPRTSALSDRYVYPPITPTS